MVSNAKRSGELPEAIICDVDGTLCDVRSIRHHVERPIGLDGTFRPDFVKFHGESIDSPINHRVAELLVRARSAGLAVIIVTAREARWSFLTSTWLTEHGVVYDELLMRPAKDHRSDALVKEDMAENIVRQYRPVLAIDDRADIIGVWQRAGIPTSFVSPNGDLGQLEWPLGRPAEVNVEALLLPR